MNRVINTTIVIFFSSIIFIFLLYFGINTTIDLVDYNNRETINIEQINNGENINKRFVRLENVVPYYSYAIKTYNSFTGPNKPIAIYYTVFDRDKMPIGETIRPFDKARIIIKDKNYNKEMLKTNKSGEITLNVMSFDAKVINDIPESVKKTIISKDFNKIFDKNIIFLEKDKKPLSLLITLLFYIGCILMILFILLIIKRGGIEIIKSRKGKVKLKNISDNIGDV